MLQKTKKEELITKTKNREWKNKSQRYLFELQKLLDKIDNIEDEELKLSIIYQVIKCDNVLTQICEELIEKQNMY